MFGDIIHKIRNGLDDIGSFITGQPAHGQPIAPAPSVSKPPQVAPQQFQNPGQPRLGAPTSMLPTFTQPQQNPTLPQLPKFNPQGQFVNPGANKFAQNLTAGNFKTPQPTLAPKPPVNATTIYHDANGNVIGWEDPNTHQDVQSVPNLPQPQPDASIIHDVTHNPITNTIGDFLVKPVVQTGEKTINTIGALGAGVGGLVRAGYYASQNDPTDEANAIAQTNAAIANRLAPGKAFMTMNEAQNADLFGNAQQRSDFIKPVVNATAQIAPYVVGPEAGALTREASLPVRMGAQSGIWGGLGAGGTAAQEWVNNQPLNAKDIAKGGAQTAIMGGLSEGLPEVATKASDAIKTNAPKAVNALHNAIQSLPNPIRSAAVSTAAADKPVMTMPASSLTPTDLSGYGDLDPQRVAFYKQQFSQGAPVEPILTMEGNDGNMYVEDGKHRLAALQQLGAQNIPIKVVTPADIHAIAQGGYFGKLDATPSEPTSPELQPQTPDPTQQLETTPEAEKTNQALQDVANTNESSSNNTLVRPNRTAPSGAKFAMRPTPKARLTAPTETGRINTFLKRINQREGYGDNLESNVKKLLGHYQANRGALRDILKANKSFSKSDLEAVYHHAEDSTSPLTPKQQEIFDKHYAPLRQVESKAMNELALRNSAAKPEDVQAVLNHVNDSTTPLTSTQQKLFDRYYNNGSDNYIHRVAQDKGSNLEGYFNGRRQSPEEGVNRKTIDAAKGRTIKALEDENGNRTVVSIKAPKDELGKSTGTKHVTALVDGKEPEDLGTFKTKTNEELMKSEIKPFQTKLDGIAKEIKALQNVRTKGGVSEARLNNLAKKAAELQFIKDEEGGLTASEARSLRDATIKFKELSRVKPNATNVSGRLNTLGSKAADLLNKVNEISDNYNPDELNGRVFIDKNGNRYTIGEATTKEIENNSNLKYYKEPLLNTALNAVNTKNAIAAKEFMEHWQLSPDFAEHAMKSDAGHIPDDWKPVNSPAFRGYFFDPKTAKTLDTYFGSSGGEEGSFAKAWNGATNVATQFIVINPEVHGLNLYFQAMIAAGKAEDKSFISRALGGPVRALKFNASLGKVMFNPESRAELLDNYLRNGGHFMSYGKDTETMLTKALAKSHLPGVNKLNAQAMSGIDATIRAALWDSSKGDYRNPEDAINNIDKFMGEKSGADSAAHNIIMFYHWLTTEGKAIGSQVRHPIQNVGANVNTGLLFLAVTYGVNSVWQKMTGNQNAHFRYPGELGLIHDVASIPGDLQKGNVAGAASVATSHLNPLLMAGANQLFGKDYYTGQPVQTGKQRATELIQNLIAPAQNVSKVTEGKSTLPEQIANEMGFYTPHVKGTAAAPNWGDSIFNTPGATLNTNQAYASTQQYYNALNNLTQSLAGTGQGQDAATAQKFIERDRTPQGQSEELSQQQTASNWGDVAGNLPVLLALQKFYQSTGSHNPEWDLSGNGTINGQAVPKLQLWATYKSLSPGDLQKDAIAQQNPWISDTENAVANWASQQNFSGNVVQSPNYVPYPTINPNVQSMMSQLTQLTSIPSANRTPEQSAQISALEQNPDLQSAYQQLDAYTNAVRSKWNLPQVQYAPNVPIAVQNFENKYMGSDKTTRTTLRTQFPDLYNQMQQAMERQSLASAEKYGGEGYYGAALPDSYLSDLYSLGNYDIAKIPNANGTNTYALDNFTGSGSSPNGLPQAVGNAVSSSSSKSSSNSAQRRLIHSLKYGSRLKDVRLPRKPYVHSTAVHNRQIRIGGGPSVVPKGHYTGVTTIKKGSKPIRNIKVAGVKQYKPAA